MEKETYYIISLKNNHPDCFYLPPVYIKGAESIDVNSGEIILSNTSEKSSAYMFNTKEAAVNFITLYMAGKQYEKYDIKVISVTIERSEEEVYSSLIK